MVKSVKNMMSLTGSGIKDWFIQRVSAVLMAIYIILLVGALISHSFLQGPVTYSVWMGLFCHTWFKIATFVFLLSLMLHAWIGMWTIFTDYIHCSVIRGVLMTLVLLGMFACTVWGIWIIVGIN